MLRGGPNDDSIDGGGGNDTLPGGSGQNTLNGSAGNDVLHGDAGNTDFGSNTLSGGSGNDVYDGDEFDTVDFTGINAPVDISFDGKANDGPQGSSDNFLGIGTIITSGNGDIIVATKLNYGLVYHATGAGGIFNGTNFTDLISMDGGGTIFANGGNDIIHAGIGTTFGSSIEGGVGNDFIVTGDGNDHINAGDGNDSVLAGGGDDVINGGNGKDTLHGEAGNDYVRGFRGNDHLYGDDGNDTMLGEGTVDSIYGGAGSDSFYTNEKLAGWVKDFNQSEDVLI